MGKKKLLAALAAGASLAAATQALSQATGNQPTPPTNYNLDQNGVDVVTGSYYLQTVDVSIGDRNGGLQYTRFSRNFGYDDDYTTNALTVAGSTVTVSIGAISDTFAVGSPMSQRGTGATLTQTAGAYTYRTSSGVSYVFSATYLSNKYRLANQRIASITWPDGRVLTFEYQTLTPTICQNVEDCEEFKVSRVIAVGSNDGYRLNFTNLRAGLGPFATEKDGAEWMTVKSVVASNDAIEYCTPSSCTAPNATWPSVRYAWSGSTETRTDAMGRQTVIGYNSSNLIVSVRYGSGSTAPRTLTYDGAGRVATFTVGASTWNYVYSDVGGVRTTTVTSPSGLVRTVTSNPTILRITSDKTGTAQATNYEYNAQTQLIRVTAPEGNKTEYEYADATLGISGSRGNVLKTRSLPKTGTDNIETTATYPSDEQCATLPAAKCNLPTSTTDARGNTTSFDYYDFGAPRTITQPAPTSGAAQPQTRYLYEPRTAWYKNAAGTIVQGSEVQKLISTSQCFTGTAPTCVGTADETTTILNYGPGDAATPNNLLVRSVTSRSGNTSGTGAVSTLTTLAYDVVGNMTLIDGPLPTADDDVVYRRYNANRELTGEISPRSITTDPTRRATRVTRNSVTGLIEKVEAGTVEGTSDSAWNAFVSLQRVESDYDAATYLKTVDRGYGAGASPLSLTQYSYDLDLRAKCTATRIALTTAADVCQQLSDATGFDQIAETVYYTTDGRVQKQRTNLTDTATFVYTANGQVQTLTDANGNVSTYGYDAYDRRDRLTYPGGSFDAVAYDKAGNVTLETRRNGATVTNGYDTLNRRTTRTPSTSGNIAPTTYTYDNLGRLTRAQATGTGAWSSDHLFGYDALSRLTSSTAKRSGAIDHALGMLYDAAGRRTRLTWWDGFYVDYAYLVTGEVQRIRERVPGDPFFVLATLGYDDLGRRTSLTRGNGTVTTYTPDGLSRLQGQADNFAGTGRDQSVMFGYNGVSQLRTRSATNDAYAFPGYAPSSVASVPNARNQFQSVGGIALNYDFNGNLTADNRGNAYTYNIDNQLTAKTGAASLAYDPIGRLTALTPAATPLLRMDYDGTMLVAESNAAGTLTRRYVHGPGVDEPLVTYEGAGASQRRWLAADERGSITASSDTGGAVRAINAYDEFGVPAERNVGRFGYTGQAWLGEVGLAYYKARMYDPVLGRFMQTDPIRYDAGMNLYAYVGGDPVNKVDPWGLTETDGCPGDSLRNDRGGCFGPIVVTASCVYSFCNGGHDKWVSPRTQSVFDIAREKLGLAAQYRKAKFALEASEGSPQNGCRRGGGVGAFLAPGAAAAEAGLASRIGSALSAGAARLFGALGALLSLSGDTPQPRRFRHYGYSEQAGNFAGGLRAGAFATTASGAPLTGSQAQSLLALPSRGSVPNAYYNVTVAPNVPVVGPSTVAPANGQPGGGVEYTFPNGTPPGSVGPPNAIPSC